MRTLPRSIAVAACLGVLFLAAGWQHVARAANAVSTLLAPPVVAIVDLERVTNQLQEMKDPNAAREERFKSLQAQVKSAQERAKELGDKLKAQAPDDPLRRVIYVEAFEAEALAEAKANALQKVLDVEAGDAISGVYAKVCATIAAIARDDKIDLVLVDDRGIKLPTNVGQKTIQAVITTKRILFANPALDITSQVISRMDNDYNAGKKN
jgi:Skp family chaperone for outer membrane proteins